MQVVTEGVWEVRRELRLPGGVTFPLRMTVVRLPDDSLWLHSPVPVDDATAAAIDAAGEVRHVVAPTLVHTLSLKAAQQRWPAARLHGVLGLQAKVPELRIDTVLEGQPPEAWSGAFDVVPIDGAPTLNEAVFLHRPSRSVLLSDLVFNFAGSNLITRALLWMVGCQHGVAASRSWGWASPLIGRRWPRRSMPSSPGPSIG